MSTQELRSAPNADRSLFQVLAAGARQVAFRVRNGPPETGENRKKLIMDYQELSRSNCSAIALNEIRGETSGDPKREGAA
jgi:hypothetical protein